MGGSPDYMLDGTLAMSLHTSAPSLLVPGIRASTTKTKTRLEREVLKNFPMPDPAQKEKWDNRWPGAHKGTQVGKREDPFHNPNSIPPEEVDAPMHRKPPPRLFASKFGEQSDGLGIVHLRAEHDTGRMYWTVGQGAIEDLVPVEQWKKITDKSFLTNAAQGIRHKVVVPPSVRPKRVRYSPLSNAEQGVLALGGCF